MGDAASSVAAAAAPAAAGPAPPSAKDKLAAFMKMVKDQKERETKEQEDFHEVVAKFGCPKALKTAFQGLHDPGPLAPAARAAHAHARIRTESEFSSPPAPLYDHARARWGPESSETGPSPATRSRAIRCPHAAQT